jgi:hypothetical protein
MLLTAGFVLLALFLAEVFFRGSATERGLEKENLYVSKAKELSQLERPADIVFTGDSRILHGIHPQVIQATIQTERAEELFVYNAALPGSPPMGQLAMIRRALSREPKPRLIVMSISPYMFSSRINVAMARESLSAVWRLADLPTAFRAHASAEDLALIATSELFRLYRFRPRLLDLLLNARGVGAEAGTGSQGFVLNGEVDAATQDARAQGRAEGYRFELLKPEAKFGNEHTGYFIEALAELKRQGVKALVLNSPSATQVDVAYGPSSIYGEHIAWVRARVAEAGAIWADVQHPPVVSDQDFTDGDHLGGSGAHRFSAWLAHTYVVPALGGRRTDRPAGCKPLFTFEEVEPAGFVRTGSAFQAPQRAQAARFQWPVYGYTGSGFWSSFGAGGDADQGEATTPAFVIDKDSLRVRVGGGAAPSQSVTLIVAGQEVASVRGHDDESLRDENIDTRSLLGRSAVLRLRDQGSGSFEHLNIDDVASCP